MAVVLGAWALLAVAFVIVTRPGGFEGYVADVLPVDGERALVLTRNRVTGPDRLELVDRHGKRRWQSEVPAVDEDFGVSRHGGYAIANGRLTIVAGGTDDAPGPRTLSYDLASGRRVWAVRESGRPSGNPFTPAVLTDGRRVFRLPGSRSIVARDVATGRLLWRWRSSREGIHRVWLRRTTLVVDDASGRVDVVDSATGTARRLRTWSMCVLDEAVLYTRAGILRRHALADGADTALMRALDPRDPRDVTLRGVCGRRGAEIVVPVEIGYRRAAVVGLAAGGRRVAWRIDLGARWLVGEPDPYLDAHPLAGRLGRFPAILAEDRASNRRELLVLDLDRHRITWKSGPTTRFYFGFVARYRDIAYAVETLGDNAVVRVDPATGRPGAAARFGADPDSNAHVFNLQPAGFAGGRLGLDGRREGKHRSIVLDASTLTPLDAPGWLRVTDVLADLKALSSG